MLFIIHYQNVNACQSQMYIISQIQINPIQCSIDTPVWRSQYMLIDIYISEFWIERLKVLDKLYIWIPIPDHNLDIIEFTNGG